MKYSDINITKGASPFRMRDQVDIIGRDYTNCKKAKCQHLEDLGRNPILLPCPSEHIIRLRNVTVHNTFCASAIDNIIRQLNGDATPFSMQLLYFAMGTGTSITTDATISLDHEVDRIPLINLQKLNLSSGFYKQEQASAFVDIDHGNANLQEFAMFAGAATSSPNSGSIIVRALNPWGDKTPSDTISVIWTITGSGQ